MSSLIPEPEPPTVPDAVTIARLEGKIDRLIDKVDGVHGIAGDHETRLREHQQAIADLKATSVTRASVLAWLGILTALMTVALAGVALLVGGTG